MTLISLGTCCNARSHIKLSIHCSFCVPKSDLWQLLPPALRPPLLPPPTLRRHVQAHAPPVPVSALPLRSRACNRSRTQGPSARPCARGSLARPAVHYNSTGTTQLGRSPFLAEQPAIACRRSQAHRTAPHRTALHCTSFRTGSPDHRGIAQHRSANAVRCSACCGCASYPILRRVCHRRSDIITAAVGRPPVCLLSCACSPLAGPPDPHPSPALRAHANHTNATGAHIS